MPSLDLSLSIASRRSLLSYDIDALLYINANTAMTSAQKDAWNTFVVTGKTDGWWSKMLCIYPYIGGTAAAHAINAKTPGTYNITWNGTVTHNANGAAGDGSTGYGDTGWIARSVLPDVTGSYSLYNRTSGSVNGVDTGARSSDKDTNNGVELYGTLFKGRTTAQSGIPAGYSVAGAEAGFYAVTRPTVGGSSYMSKNGSTVATYSEGNTLATDLPNRSYLMFNLNGLSVRTSRNHAFAHIGYAMSEAEVSLLYTAVQALQTALGRQV